MDEFQEITNLSIPSPKQELQDYLASAIEAIKDNIYLNLGKISEEEFIENHQQFISTCHPEMIDVCSHCVAAGIINRLDKHFNN